MTWKLMVLKYDGQPPRWRHEAVANSRCLPLGTPGQVRQHASEGLPGIEWGEAASLAEQLRQAGMGARDAGEEEIMAGLDRPWVVGRLQADDFSLVLDAFHGDIIHGFFVTVHGMGNPVPALAQLCRAGGWCLAEATEDGECFDLSESGQARLAERHQAALRQAEVAARNPREVAEEARFRRRQANERAGLYRFGDHCPRCGFAYGWDGRACDHCRHTEV